MALARRNMLGLPSDWALPNLLSATFFRILGERRVSLEDLDAKLREIATRHKALLDELKTFHGEDPELTAIKERAAKAVSDGEYVAAETLLKEAEEYEIAVATQMQERADRRYLGAAKSRAERGMVKMIQFAYGAAAEDFHAAGVLVPDSMPSVRARYVNQAGIAAYEGGDYQSAQKFLEQALSIREDVLDSDNVEIATSLDNLAALYRTQGKFDEVEPLHRRALAIMEKALGPEHPRVAITLQHLAGLYKTQGKYDEAEPLYRRALEIEEKALGSEHPRVAITHDNLAVLYSAQGRYDEAEPLYRRALVIEEKTLGTDHPDVAITLNNLASLYLAQGKYDEAEPLYRRALAIMEKVLGPEHPRIAITLDNLAA